MAVPSIIRKEKNVTNAEKTLSIFVKGEDVDLLLAVLTSAKDVLAGRDEPATERELLAVEMLDTILRKANA